MRQPLFLLVYFIFLSFAVSQTTRYVRPSIMGNGSGSSWENASNDLQHMINQSAPGDRIFVAVGTYKPIRRADATGSITSNDSRNSFVMKQGVSIYGGFNPANGITEDLDMRILPGMGSGSILSGNLGSNSSYHVVIAAGSNAGLLDGFIIQEGVARSNNTMTVNGETIDSKNGGGIAVSNAEVRFVNCWIRGNHSRRGAGAFIYATNTSTPHTTHFTNCIFSGNYADRLNGNDGHGGGIYSDNGRARLYNCTISSNRAGGGRGGAILSSGNIYLHNSIMRGNTAGNGQNGVRIDGGSYIAEYCLLGDTGDSPTSSTGNIGGNPNFISEPGTDSLPTTAGNFRLHFGSSCINTGNNSLVPTGIATHIGGRVRVQAGIVDRGAFESVANPIAFDQTFCVGNTFSDLIAEGENLKWYAAANGGTPLALNMEITPGTYYVSQTISGWESQRTAVNVTYAIETPTASSPQIIYSGALILELEASGENLQWYNVATGGEPLDPSAALTTGLYYVSQTIDGCESSRTEVNVNTANIAKYVKPVAVGNGDGSNWDNAASDLQAVINASNDGDYIFVAGGTYKPNRKANALNTVTPNNRDNAFVMKSGVRLYGGFAGTESSVEERDLANPANATILSGDFNDNDVVSGSGASLSISGNDENAIHVVIIAGPMNSYSLLDGFVIKGGNANINETLSMNNGNIRKYNGGGIYFQEALSYPYSNFQLINCLITQNYCISQGGGLYIGHNQSMKITNCVFSRNYATGRGSAIISMGDTSIFNSTIWGNRVDYPYAYGTIIKESYILIIQNSIAFGNNSGILPYSSIGYSLIQGNTSTNNGNINGNLNPLFVDPENGDFRLQLLSPAANRGSNAFVQGGTTTDIAGNPRIQDCAVDLGAYESEPIPAPVIEDTFCMGQTLADLVILGNGLKFYGTVSGGSPLPLETELVDGATYYVSQTINGCESPRTVINVTVYPIPIAPEAEASQSFCWGTVSDLLATGENLQWYDTVEGGTPLDPDTLLTTGTYYVSQTMNDCESPRVEVSVTLQVEFPIAPSPQIFAVITTIADLEATGENLQWYDTAEGGEPLAPSMVITAGTYYVSQTVGSCESSRFPVEMITSYPVRYVKTTASGSGDGSSWENASNDLQAMINASSNGDYIFVAGGTYKPIRPANNLHTIDFNIRDNAFVLKSGVKIYGNFAGTETSLEERDLSFTENRSILSGDFNGNDVVTGSGGNLSISGNGENAHRVVFSIENNAETLLDGFTIQGGNAVGSSSINVNGVVINDQFGGGMYYRNSTTYVFNTVFTGNNATYGGGLYIGDNSLNLRIVNSVFSKNMATSGGSALYNIRRPYIINCTFWGNRSTGENTSAVYSGNGTFYFRNNIVYDNNGGFSNGTSQVHIDNSLVQGMTATTNSNIHGSTNPLFMDPENGDFRLKPHSPVINKGNNSYLPAGTTTDIKGNIRIQLNTVDLGAYESPSYGVIWTTSNNWLDGIEPDEEKSVYIEGNLYVGVDYGSFAAQSLKVEQGGSIVIHDGNYVKVHGEIINSNADDPDTEEIDEQASAFIIKSGGNLIQTIDYQIDGNTGHIKVERESQEIVRLDYTLWSSPVRGQQIQAFSPMTLPNRIYTYETNSSNQETNGAYEAVGDVFADFGQGKGYLFRAPNDWISEDSETGIPYPGRFIGEPINGNIAIPTYPFGFTSVGNPYPSNIDPQLFLNFNSGSVSNLFFWNNPQRIYNEETQSWGYTGSRYVAFSNMGFSNSDYEGKSISVGQGFIVYATGNSVNFDNSMRTTAEESFFKTNELERHRFWLKLSDKYGRELNQILTGYMAGATNGIDEQIEGEQFGYEGSAIYNLIDEQKYAIQGRALPFEITDSVPIGFKSDHPAKYTISLTNFDGLFSEGNTNIYLNDKFLGTTHNLMESDYDFESQEGEFKNRFEIVYQKQDSPMGSNDWNLNAVQIYRNNQNIIIESKTEKINSVEFYDLQGRCLYRNENVNARYIQIPTERFGVAVLIVNAQTQSGKTKTKKILNK